MINKVKKYFTDMRNIVVHSNKYWSGEASNTHRQKFLEKDEMLEEILLRFKEHSTDLVKMAGNYQNAEDAIADQLVNQLPDNVII